MLRAASASLAFALGASLTLAVPFAVQAQDKDAGKEKALAFKSDAASLKWGPCPEFMPEGCQIAVLHGDPAKENADIFFRVPGGSEIARHWHNSPERMVLVTGTLQVDYDGQDPVTLSPGTYAYGPSRHPHSATCQSADACTLYIGFVDPIDAMKGAPDE